MIDSPYRPGFGTVPPVLVGRDDLLNRARLTFSSVANSQTAASSQLVMTGPRGLGKTVMLNVIAEEAARRGFVTARATLNAVSDNPQLLARCIAGVMAPWESRSGKAWRRFHRWLESLDLQIDTGVVSLKPIPAASPAPSVTATQHQHVGELLRSAADLAVSHERKGLVLFLDELQAAPRQDLIIIGNALQDVLQEPSPPIAVFAAGLPNTPETIGRDASFTERFDYRQLTRLDGDSAARGLLEPADRLGVRWDPGAADLVLRTANGFPYLLQKLAHETWNAAAPEAGHIIPAEVVAAAIADLRPSLEAGMFRSRWNKATPAERRLLAAIAEVADADGVASTHDITAITGRTAKQLSMARKGLIDKALIEPAGWATLRFTTPGFDAFVRDQQGIPGTAPSPQLPAATRPQLTARPTSDRPPALLPEPHQGPTLH